MPDVTQDRIEIPLNEAGRRCYDVLAAIALRQLQRAREAVTARAADAVPGAELVDEQAMRGGKYAAMFAAPDGSTTSYTYDYVKKVIGPA